MITLRCTKRLLHLLDAADNTECRPPTSKLGNWYANLVPTIRGELVVFMNEHTLLTVAVPKTTPEELIRNFIVRVENILTLLEFPEEIVEEEVKHIRQIEVAAAKDFALLGSLHNVVKLYKRIAEDSTPGRSLKLSPIEKHICERPTKAVGFRTPVEVAMQLLTQNKSVKAHNKT